jgi:hypothetical protein
MLAYLARTDESIRPGQVLIHGLIPPIDKSGFRMHNIAIVGAARQPAFLFGSYIMWPELGTSQLAGVTILNLLNHSDTRGRVEEDQLRRDERLLGLQET